MGGKASLSEKESIWEVLMCSALANQGYYPQYPNLHRAGIEFISYGYGSREGQNEADSESGESSFLVHKRRFLMLSWLGGKSV